MQHSKKANSTKQSPADENRKGHRVDRNITPVCRSTVSVKIATKQIALYPGGYRCHFMVSFIITRNGDLRTLVSNFFIRTDSFQNTWTTGVIRLAIAVQIVAFAIFRLHLEINRPRGTIVMIQGTLRFDHLTERWIPIFGHLNNVNLEHFVSTI